jgi:choline-glycine betaine transporter
MVVIIFSAIALAGLLASFGVERLLRVHLRRVLVDVCETEARSGFWVAVAGLSIVLTGVLAATATFGYSNSQVSGFDLFLGAMTQARTLMIGLLGIVLVLAAFLLSAIRRFEAGRRQLPPAAWGWESGAVRPAAAAGREAPIPPPAAP